MIELLTTTGLGSSLMILAGLAAIIALARMGRGAPEDDPHE